MALPNRDPLGSHWLLSLTPPADIDMCLGLSMVFGKMMPCAGNMDTLSEASEKREKREKLRVSLPRKIDIYQVKEKVKAACQ